MKNALYTTFNDAFLETGATMIYSFLDNNKWFEGDIIILHDEGDNCKFSDENKNILKKFSDKIKFKQVNSKDYAPIFENFPRLTQKHFKSSFYKLEMMKKDEYDIKFYIDADVCFNDSVEELFKIETDKIKAFMCRDICSNNYGSYNVSLKTDEDYANMGFLIIDGRKLTENDYSNIFKFCSTITFNDYKNKRSFKGVFGDQDCLNEYFADAALLPALVYDANITQINKDNIDKVKIFHYYGAGRKPWDCDLKSNAFDIWYRNNYFVRKKLY